MEAEAGVRTATIARLARENGAVLPARPRRARAVPARRDDRDERRRPARFKYGVTGDWVTGLEAVLAPGELVRVGGPARKDVAGYDLRALLTGSEGTLGIVTAAWLRFVPAPERAAGARRRLPRRRGRLRRGAARAGQRRRAGGARVLRRGRRSARAGAAFRRRRCAGFVVVAEADGARGRGRAGARRAARGARAGRRALHAPELDARALALARRRLARRRGGRAGPSSPRTSRCPSTGWRRRSPRPARSARATTSTPARGATPATATSTPVPARPRRRGAARPRGRGRAGAVRSRAAPRRHRHRRARHRRAEGRPALAPVGAGRRRGAARDQARARSEGALQPRKKEP